MLTKNIRQLLACPHCKILSSRWSYFAWGLCECSKCHVALEPTYDKKYGLMIFAVGAGSLLSVLAAQFLLPGMYSFVGVVIAQDISIVVQTLFAFYASRVFTVSFQLKVKRPFSRLYLSEMILMSLFVGSQMAIVFDIRATTQTAVLLATYIAWGVFEVWQYW